MKDAYQGALHKIIEVEWLDSRSRGGWETKEEYLKSSGPLVCHSSGYLLRLTPKVIELVQSTEQYGKVNDSIAIPRSCVRWVRTVGKTRRKR